MLLLCVFALHSFRVDWNTVAQTGSIDYRNRITGARLLEAGRDPYHYKWRTGDPDRWRDPYDNPALPITKTTVTPALLWVTAPFAALPYPAAQIGWLFAQWGFLIGIWGLWMRTIHGTLARWIWSALVVGFTYTLAWRHHIDRGQCYVMLAFLMALWLSLSLRTDAKNRGLAGATAGFLLALRPPLLLFLAPFMLLHRRGQWLGMLLGFALGLAGPIWMMRTCWTDYAKGMNTWSEVYRTDQNPRPGPQAFPAEIEGLPVDQLARYQVKQYVDSSVFRLCRILGWSPVSDKLVLAVLVLTFAIWFWWQSRGSPESVLIGIAAWSFLADGLLPAYRNPYNDIMILNLLAMTLALPKIRWSVMIFALLALGSGWLMVSIHPPSRWWIYLPSLALLGAALCGLFPPRGLARNHSIPPIT